MAIVRLYTSTSQGGLGSGSLEFVSMQLGGILCFVVDRRRRTYHLRLFDINTLRLTFQLEIYINMHKLYREVKPGFHCFPVPEMVIGIEYSD